MKKFIIFTIMAAIVTAASSISADVTKVDYEIIVNHQPTLLQSISDIQVVAMDNTSGCVCTQAFKRWPWENTYWRQCYNTGGDHEIWAEAGSCGQSSCFPSTHCGATP